MLVVLDTNVIVSGLLNGSGKPGKVIDLVLNGRFQVAYDDRILGEYEDVLARPELHIQPLRAREVIALIEFTGCFINAEPFSSAGFSDLGDLPFVEVFVTANARALVTGNLRHFTPLIEQKFAVYNPAQFLDVFFPEP